MPEFAKERVGLCVGAESSSTLRRVLIFLSIVGLLRDASLKLKAGALITADCSVELLIVDCFMAVPIEVSESNNVGCVRGGEVAPLGCKDEYDE